ncbi:MAG: hypothetical protein CL943_02265 [Candidatus Diapherotrites archaeon]|uniref:TIGR00725 family protein n=1 Tax=Candidatus Iainarchaeum sp. TaxID=3101447 RepID=A0A2D6M103_9ARCH|nr:hypothetical protein [Candidatus Diapherotrites archaeon]
MSRKFKIGVMGAATGSHDSGLLEKARGIGSAIAKSESILVYGATIGVPQAAAEAASEANAFVLGVSPAASEKEHLEKYKLPLDACSATIYTGFGFNGRNIILVRSCDAVIIANGRVGIMIEFGAAYVEEKVIGVLTGTGGISDKAKELEELFAGKCDATIIYDNDPEKLVEKVVAELNKQKN